MSGQQFDDLTKAVANGANGTTRRNFLKRLIVGAGAAVVPLGAAGRAAAQIEDSKCKPLEHKCLTNVECCSRWCDKNGHQCTCIPDEELVCPRLTGQLECVTKCHNANNPCETSACDPLTGGCMVVPIAGAVCRDASGPCDLPAVCDGLSTACPPNPLKVAGTICREANGACDVPEVCTGAEAQCPADAVAPAGTPCRDSSGACEGIALCNGTSKTCPPNPLVEAGTLCRPARNQCDLPEYCTGSDPQCPSDQVEPDGTPCDRDQDLCTLDTCQNGTCTAGGPKTCPANTNPCRVNVCVPATGNCVEQNLPNDTPCETDDDLCTVQACRSGTCTVVSRTQCAAPSNPCKIAVCEPATGLCVEQNVPNATPCATDNDLCTTQECRNGNCAVVSNRTCPASTNPCKVNVCDPATGNCVEQNLANGTACEKESPPNLCTIDRCQNGTCTTVSTTTCPAPSDPCKVSVCEPATGLCVTANAADGTVCSDQNPCTLGDVCMNGTCRPGTTPAPPNTVCGTNRVCCGTTCCAAGQVCCATGTTTAGQCRLPVGASCTANSQCCSNMCGGPPGNRTCRA